MANPIEEFAKTRSKLPTIPTIANPIEAFSASKTLGRTTSPVITLSKTEEGKKKLTKWQWLGKQLMKPVGTVAVETEALGRFIGTGQAYIPGKAGLEVLSGKREASFSDVWARNATGFGLKESTARKIGFVFDIADDPFMFIGGGLTKLGRLATKVSSLTKAGKTIVPTGRGVIKTFFMGEDIATQITKSGYTAEQLALAGTKLGQVEKGQRALITALGKPIIKGTKIYEATQRFKAIVGASKVGDIARRTFSTKTGVKELDELVENFNNLSSYRKQEVITQAGKIERQIKKMSPDDIKMVVDVVEDATVKATVKDKNVLGVANKLEDLFTKMKTTEKGKGILKTELENYFPHIKADLALGDRIKYFFNPKKYSAALGASKGRAIEGTVAEINARFGKEFFQSNPTLAYAQRGLASAKAVSAKEFLDEAGKMFFKNAEDAPIGFIESANPLFKGLKAEPEIVKAVDQYIQGIQPDDLKLIVRAFDSVQNWWKAQVLISPSYHMRNMISNFWSNWLAGVKNPIVYAKARAVQSGKKANEVISITDAGEKLTRGAILKGAKQRDVIGRGWYGADITQALSDEIGGRWRGIVSKDMWKPWSQKHLLIKTNRAVGSAIEDNARLAHYIDKLQKGFSADDAARSVKKFLFDYSDLTSTEQNIFKRLIPFYTWTRKNIPLQIENLIVQPEKFAAIPKVIEQIEAGVADPKTEKYMSEYITENIPLKVRTNEQGNTEYFLLGNWLPAASAIDVLSNPIDTLINMTTPLLKTPYELWANKSTFFKNTLGESSKIEYYYKQPTEFIGITMRRKTATLIRNIRILNDLNKFIKTPAKDETENSWVVKMLDVMFGRAVTYDIGKARYFYQRETTERVNELKASIKKAQKLGDTEHAKELAEELRAFQKERGK